MGREPVEITRKNIQVDFFSEDHQYTGFSHHGKSSEISGDWDHLYLIMGSGLEADIVPAEFRALPMFKTYKKNSWDSFYICFKKSDVWFPVFSSQLIYLFPSLRNFQPFCTDIFDDLQKVLQVIWKQRRKQCC